MINLEQSGSRIPDAFLWTVTFYLIKTGIKTKNFLHSSHTIILSNGNVFAKNCYFLQINADISKIKRALVLKGILSETKYVCVLKYEISSL